MLYLDTSALLKLYVLEPGSKAVQESVAGQSEPLPVWEIQEMELNNALQLKVFWKELTAKEVAYQWSLFTQRKASGFYYMPEIRRPRLMSEFSSLAGLTPQLGCRTIDIMHVACACQLQPQQFISFDERQKKLAREAGLNVPDLSD
ncbi:MAG: type II toxin-antitoxin system VapC family toxin [Opitutales bacterium]